MSDPVFIVPDWPAPPAVYALQTTRMGGFSRAPYESFNLGAHVGDDPRAVAQNRALLRGKLPAMPNWLTQAHGTRVACPDAGKHGEADAVASRVSGHVCAVMTADCLPALFCDCAGTVVAAAHAGWRGLCAGVLENTVAAMRAPPADILVWLGPAIGPQAFEVGEDVRAAFLRRDPAADMAFSRHGARTTYLADLYALARQRLSAAGVTAIFGGGFCTYTEHDRFFSFRRDRRTGRMASLIWRE
ncbi:MAG: peptidoglycan editing factor PgeF [Zoogloeaceae bacterium]|jgi:YfiH family protein|nr:peptidoglycan editing factor PgeF [Zoogloeaceae bacterium]